MRNSQHLLVPSALYYVYINLWLTGWYLQAVLPPIVTLNRNSVNSLPAAKQPPVRSGAVFAEIQHYFILMRVLDLSTQPLWVLTSTGRGLYFLLKIWLQSLNQGSLWAVATRGCTVKGLCSVPTSTGGKAKMGYVLCC